ncbi:hypothetical protein [Mycoplasma sp. P36-A1]|uniref:hypothetical protein n=1 Tax=Mycoplasma sp. P36-A1 TaxID=3252900 RepID=UPI003C2FD6C3
MKTSVINRKPISLTNFKEKRIPGFSFSNRSPKYSITDFKTNEVNVKNSNNK